MPAHATPHGSARLRQVTSSQNAGEHERYRLPSHEITSGAVDYSGIGRPAPFLKRREACTPKTQRGGNKIANTPHPRGGAHANPEVISAGDSCLRLAILTPVLRAQNASKTYLIVAKGQNASSTAAVRRSPRAGHRDGDVRGPRNRAASSSDPDFAAALSADGAVQSVSEDPQIPWLPNDTVIAADVDGFRCRLRMLKRSALNSGTCARFTPTPLRRTATAATARRARGWRSSTAAS